MDASLIEYYEERFRMFGSPAWKQLIEDVVRMHTATNDLRNLKTSEDLHFKRGELNIMEWILNLEEMSTKAYNDLKLGDVPDADL